MTADERWNDRLMRRTGWRSDREAVLAIQQSRRWNGPDGVPPLGYVSAELQADREVVLAAVQKVGYALQYASTEMLSDREVVLAAVQNNGYMLQYASAELQADREVVLAAVKVEGGALRYASTEMKADRGIVMAAVTQSLSRSLDRLG